MIGPAFTVQASWSDWSLRLRRRKDHHRAGCAEKETPPPAGSVLVIRERQGGGRLRMVRGARPFATSRRTRSARLAWPARWSPIGAIPPPAYSPPTGAQATAYAENDEQWAHCRAPSYRDSQELLAIGLPTWWRIAPPKASGAHGPACPERSPFLRLQRTEERRCAIHDRRRPQLAGTKSTAQGGATPRDG